MVRNEPIRITMRKGGAKHMKRRKVILLGKMLENLEKGLAVIDVDDIDFITCTSLETLSDALKVDGVNTVITGAGLDLSVRLDAVRMIFEASDGISVHLKDLASGPEGFGPFAKKVLGR